MNEIPQTRASLLLRLGNESQNAWPEFLSIYESALYGFCRAKGLQDADARDVLQDVLTAVMKKLPDWDSDSSKGSFRGWLFRVARNIAIDEVKRKAKKVTASGDTQVGRMLAEVPGPNDPQDQSFETEYQRALLDWASSQVKNEVRENTWLSFRMTALEGQKAEQVAEALGVSVGTVYTAKCRVVARIRNVIAVMGEEFEMSLE
ncbi:RNA polymerase sigma factor [Mariniblastus fucicola]|uniref:ECF RNA polymerase sigma factor SigE n=1 Tax=Mariniblastus fucicola TaxID=980251 RepID=A0A5B9P9H4_9BACT|nr:sigma-70 family RNA polymerase sigma factor [Mariniblastus fucicola]QEG21592.1 ECF RNA polymerase sigma factor SigE [Mariniblastus fucicola]